MTDAELGTFKRILENKQDELEETVRNRDAITIEKALTLWTKFNMLRNVNSRSATLIATQTCSGMFDPRFAASRIDPSAFASTVKNRLARGALPPSHGLPFVFGARSKLTGARRVARNRSMNSLSPRLRSHGLIPHAIRREASSSEARSRWKARLGS